MLGKRTLWFKYEHEYEHELRPALHEHVPTTTEQPFSKQNMVTVKSNLAIIEETSIPYDTAKQDKNEQLLSMTLSRDARYLNFSGESRGKI